MNKRQRKKRAKRLSSRKFTFTNIGIIAMFRDEELHKIFETHNPFMNKDRKLDFIGYVEA